MAIGVSRAIRPHPRTANGGTTAPRSAAGGIGVYNQRNLTGQRGLSTHPRALGGGQAPAAAGSPYSGQPTPSSTPTPWSAAAENAGANANLRYQNALTALGYKRTALEQEYGLDQGFNDYKANPYSRAALLEQTYKRANRSAGNSLAAAGQLYAGSSQNAETYNREHNAQERDALERVYRASLQDVANQEGEAADRRNAELSEAQWRAVEAASNAPLEPQSAPAGGGGKGGGKSGGRAKGKFAFYATPSQLPMNKKRKGR